MGKIGGIEVSYGEFRFIIVREGIHSVSRKKSGNKSLNQNLTNQEKKTNRNNDMGKLPHIKCGYLGSGLQSHLAWFLDILSCGQEEGQGIVSSKASG